MFRMKLIDPFSIVSQALAAEGMPLADAQRRVESLRQQCFAVIGIQLECDWLVAGSIDLSATMQLPFFLPSQLPVPWYEQGSAWRQCRTS